MADGVLYEGSDKREHVCAPSHGRVYYARVPRLLMREPLLGGRGRRGRRVALLPRVVEGEGCCVVGGTCRR